MAMKVYIVYRIDIGVEKVFKDLLNAKEYVKQDSTHWDLVILEREVIG